MVFLRVLRFPCVFYVVFVLVAAGAGVSSRAAESGLRRPAPANVPPMTYENVPYGDHPAQVLDFWRADVDGPAPLVVYIHGGGFSGGSHDRVSGQKIRAFLDAGMHHASVEYRLLKDAKLPAAHEDAVRAIQFLRSKAAEWGIDKDRIGAYGGSAGAQLVAYLAWHDDFADPESDDPVARESSRLRAVAPLAAQSTLDLDWWLANIPGYNAPHRKADDFTDLQGIAALALMRELSIINHISPDDPPTYLSYGMAPGDPIPEDKQRARGWKVHHVNFGLALKDRLEEAGVPVWLKYPGTEMTYPNDVAFLIDQLQK